MPPTNRIRNGVLTWYPPEGIDSAERWTMLCARCTYAVYGIEYAPKTGRLHWQMYVEIKQQMSLRTLAEILPSVHWEPRANQSTSKIAAGYCKKGSFKKPTDPAGLAAFTVAGGYAQFFESPAPDFKGEEYGCISNQGKRTDLEAAIADAEDLDISMRQVIRDNAKVAVRYHRGLQVIRNAQWDERCLEAAPEVIVYVGGAGVGKTRAAMAEWGEERRYVWQPAQGMWFDGYDGEKILVLDEFRGHIPYEMLFVMLDRYGCRLQVKGSMIELQADRVVITSPLHPRDWYEFDGTDCYSQLERRITKVVRLWPDIPLQAHIPQM